MQLYINHESAIQVFDADGVNVIVKAFTQIHNVDVKTLAEYYGVGALFFIASTNEVQMLKSRMIEVFNRLIQEHRRCTEDITKSHFYRGVNVNREAMSKTIHFFKFCLL